MIRRSFFGALAALVGLGSAAATADDATDEAQTSDGPGCLDVEHDVPRQRVEENVWDRVLAEVFKDDA